MQIVLYTEKTIAQALTALNARMQAKGTSTRPALDGWVEKNGAFSLGVTSIVAGRFNRTTHFRGKLEREGGVTVVKGQVPRGANRENMIVIYAVIAIMAVMFIAMGSTWVGLIMLPLGAALYIPLAGDYFNSELLITEIQKTLKAKDTPPKASAAKASTPRPAKKTATASRPAASASRSKAAPKPAPLLTADEDDEAEEDEIVRVPVED